MSVPLGCIRELNQGDLSVSQATHPVYIVAPCTVMPPRLGAHKRVAVLGEAQINVNIVQSCKDNIQCQSKEFGNIFTKLGMGKAK